MGQNASDLGNKEEVGTVKSFNNNQNGDIVQTKVNVANLPGNTEASKVHHESPPKKPLKSLVMHKPIHKPNNTLASSFFKDPDDLEIENIDEILLPKEPTINPDIQISNDAFTRKSSVESGASFKPNHIIYQQDRIDMDGAVDVLPGSVANSYLHNGALDSSHHDQATSVIRTFSKPSTSTVGNVFDASEERMMNSMMDDFGNKV
eukprot:TRINITY_DN2358_c0_g1_i1.p1 TRINITY_DN2358_c0_g1~~TRINITY_DN2358_c0_g1_i1.p1  ORF type:complete len:205 (+),score=55.37 TRINITY_DN2358_c0_g1_i1:115-729(+)